MPQVDDRELMMEARGGSRAAFSALVARYERRLIAYFHRQCGDLDLAEDCAQEVFVRLFRTRDRYGPQARFATFLFTIARNYWIDVVRARSVRPRERQLQEMGERDGEDPLAGIMTTSQPEPPEQAEQNEEVDRLRRALDHLPRGQREVVLLGVIEALPYSEVSRILGIPIGTVKSRVHAAVRSLRHVLEPTSVPRTRSP
jgi:RNA polymerase sigma-70 factor (ECF subfamily)